MTDRHLSALWVWCSTPLVTSLCLTPPIISLCKLCVHYIVSFETLQQFPSFWQYIRDNSMQKKHSILFAIATEEFLKNTPNLSRNNVHDALLLIRDLQAQIRKQLNIVEAQEQIKDIDMHSAHLDILDLMEFIMLIFVDLCIFTDAMDTYPARRTVSYTRLCIQTPTYDTGLCYMAAGHTEQAH